MEEASASASKFKAGDRVVGTPFGTGTWAQYVGVPETSLVS